MRNSRETGLKSGVQIPLDLFVYITRSPLHTFSLHFLQIPLSFFLAAVGFRSTKTPTYFQRRRDHKRTASHRRQITVLHWSGNPTPTALAYAKYSGGIQRGWLPVFLRASYQEQSELKQKPKNLRSTGAFLTLLYFKTAELNWKDYWSQIF